MPITHDTTSWVKQSPSTTKQTVTEVMNDNLTMLSELVRTKHMLDETAALELIEELKTLREFHADAYDTLYIISVSNSSFKSKAQAVIDRFMFGTTDAAVIAAARRAMNAVKSLNRSGAKYGSR